MHENNSKNPKPPDNSQEWSALEDWQRRMIGLSFMYRHKKILWRQIYIRFNAPFAEESWYSLVFIGILAFIVTFFALTRPYEVMTSLFKSWGIATAFGMVLFGLLSNLTQATRTIPIDHYLSATAYLIHAILITTLTGAFTFIFPNLLPWISVFFFLGLAYTLFLINILTALFVTALLFKLIGI